MIYSDQDIEDMKLRYIKRKYRPQVIAIILLAMFAGFAIGFIVGIR